MNYFYFSSNDASQMKKIDGFKDIVDFSKKALADLINIIKPKLIISLGVKDGLDIISDTRTSTILKKGNNRILTQGIIQNIKIYGIRHPSYNYAGDVIQALDQSLSELFENKNVTPFVFNESNFVAHIDITKINNNLSNHNFVFVPYNDKGIYRATYKGIGKDILDFRLDLQHSPSKKYISFRSIKKDYLDLEGKELYTQTFSEGFDIMRNNWLVYKKLKYYQANLSVEEQISNDIICLLNSIASNK